MPAALYAPPPRVNQGGTPRISAQRAPFDPSTGATTEASADDRNFRPQGTIPLSSFSASSATLSSPTDTRRGSVVGALCSRPDTPESAVGSLAAVSAAPSSTTSSRTASVASSCTPSKPTVCSSGNRRRGGSFTRDKEIDRDAATLEPKRPLPSMVPTTAHGALVTDFPSSAADGTLSSLVPLPQLVEQQRSRIFSLLQERDTASAELSEVRTLLQRLGEDYNDATRETDGLRLQLSSLRAQYEAQSAEFRQLQASHAHQQKRIEQFEGEWSRNSSLLREQLDTLIGERDAIQAQRDACMADNSDLRRQMIQLQGEVHRAESRYQEALRAQAAAHAQQLRTALQEKEEQLQARAAATRREARLVQQEMDQLSVGHTAAHEERESMRWRLSELETVVAKKEQLRAELERVVSMLRSRLTDQEEAARQDAQRYTQRAQDLELLYRGQVAQEQHRAQVLQDDLAAARKATQEALRQQEALQQSHREQIADVTTRASKLEGDLRQQLRLLRTELEEAQARALQHEAAALRSRRDAEALQAKCSSEQEVRERLQQAHTAQSQQLSRAECSIHVLRARLQEREGEAELLRCVMEQATWTREMRQAAQHTLASLLGVPRVSVRGSRRRRNGEVTAGEEEEEEEESVWSPALQLEWAAGAQGSTPSLSKRQGHQTRGLVPTGVGDIVYTVQEGSAPLPPRSDVGETASSPSSRGVAPVTRAHPGTDNPLSSPQRLSAGSTRDAARQHVETIERTVRRGTDQGPAQKRAAPSTETGHPLQPPLSFRAESPLTAPPPLHPGTPRTAAAGSPWSAQRSAGIAATAFGSNRTTISPFSSTVRGLSFAPAQNAARGGGGTPPAGRGVLPRTPTDLASAQLLSTPLLSRHQVRHVYNISEEEEDQQHQVSTVMAGGTPVSGSYATGLAHGYSPTQRLHSATPLARQPGEVFFDDVSAPRGRGVPVTISTRDADEVAGSGAEAPASHLRQAASASLAIGSTAEVCTVGTYVTPSRCHGSFNSSTTVSAAGGVQPPCTFGDSVSYNHEVSAPGVRAAELIARLSHFSSPAPFVGAPAAAAAAVSSSAVTAQRGVPPVSRARRNMLHSEDAGLQQYLRDTVQEILANHGREGAAHRRPLHAPRQRLDGNSAIPVTSDHDGAHFNGDGGGGEEEDDFGSASQPRSSVAVTLVQPTPPPTSAVDFANGGEVIHMLGPGEGACGGASWHDSEKVSNDGDGLAAASRSRHSATAAPRQTTAPVSRENPIPTSRRGGNIAHTLEQLAGRQQRLLQSLGLWPPEGMSPLGSSAAVLSSSQIPTTPADAYLSGALRSSTGVTELNSLSSPEHGPGFKHQGQHEPEDSHGIARSSMGVSAAGTVLADAVESASMASDFFPGTSPDNLARNPMVQGHPVSSSCYSKDSDAGTHVELDPRQLSYSATLSTAQISDLTQENQSVVKKRMGGLTMKAGAVVQESHEEMKGQCTRSSEPAAAMGAVAATIPPSVRSALSVSEVSSLSQLERRFSTLF
ncbi:hypothetical protein JKF63_07508 [Porcisia hertigi]|uniref:Uncharacterized protein n=1 Tax=Porcisia hertigi TaxID=2761500 RepID=A0A836IZL4_9TRYP|nr:hypothetical protein JKF63_07508 [Porcisia hertigi]